jgi:hypothetical protein
LVLLKPNLEICSGWIKTPRPLRGGTHPAGSATGSDRITSLIMVATEENGKKKRKAEKQRRKLEAESRKQ